MHDFYEVQQSTNGTDWELLGQVRQSSAQPAAEGRSRGIHYEYIDEAPAQGLNLYRIRQVDIDGAEDFSTLEKVMFFGSANDFALAPVPARERLYFTWPSDWLDRKVDLEFIDMQGKVQSVYRGLPPSDLQVSTMNAGVYQLLVRDGQGHILTRQRVVIQ
jgi:hypothetical protein